MKQYDVEGVEKRPVRFAVIAEKPGDAAESVVHGVFIKKWILDKPDVDQTTLQVIKCAEPQLMPCPFCGAPAEVSWQDDEERVRVKIQCSNVHCRAERELSISDCDLFEAAARWNCRPPDEVEV